MSELKEKLTFSEAINEALYLMMKAYDDIVVMGQLVNMPAGIFGTTSGLANEFPERVLDFPVAEALMTSAAIGMAVDGKRPVLCHQRMDFMPYSFDAIINWLALWYFKTGGQALNVVIRCIVGKGWGQAAQHSKNLAATLATIPGLAIYCPATPHDAKGMLIDALHRCCPVIFVEHRSLFDMQQHIPEDLYRVEPVPKRVCQGEAATVITIGDTLPTVLSVAQERSDLDVFDLRCIKPLTDDDMIEVFASAACTDKVVIVDSAWREFGVSAELAARFAEKGVSCIRRLGYPHTFVPMSQENEALYYSEDMFETEIAKLLD